MRRDNRINIDATAFPVDGTVATEYGIKEGAAVIRYLLGVVETYRFTVVNPLERHSGNIGPQNLLRYIGG